MHKTALSSLLVLALAGTANAASVDVRVFAPANSPEPTIMCTARIMVDPSGPDVLRMQCTGMMPGNTYTVFLGQSATPGAIPVNFLGQLTAKNNGSANFVVETEVTNAFIGVNPALDAADGFADGVANVAGAGALARGGLTVSLDYIRIYRSSPVPTPTVFGVGPAQPGGLLVATSDRIPD